jgi:hypothetical protein
MASNSENNLLGQNTVYQEPEVMEQDATGQQQYNYGQQYYQQGYYYPHQYPQNGYYQNYDGNSAVAYPQNYRNSQSYRVSMSHIPEPVSQTFSTIPRDGRGSMLIDTAQGHVLDQKPLPIVPEEEYYVPQQPYALERKGTFDRTTQPYVEQKPHDPIALVESNRKPESLDRRRFCCCFRKRWHCVSLFVFLLLVVGILIYLSIPGLPSFQVGDPYLNDSRPVATTQNPFTFTLNILEDWSVYSPSYFAWAINQLIIRVELKDATGNIVPGFLGTGTLNSLRFPARSSTNFTVVMSNDHF